MATKMTKPTKPMMTTEAKTNTQPMPKPRPNGARKRRSEVDHKFAIEVRQILQGLPEVTPEELAAETLAKLGPQSLDPEIAAERECVASLHEALWKFCQQEEAADAVTAPASSLAEAAIKQP